jgi:hypothetical protein
MWRTPVPASTKPDDEEEDATSSRVVEERAVEDSWYEVLRRKHVEGSDDD